MSRAPKKNMRVRYGQLAAVSITGLTLDSNDCEVVLETLPDAGTLLVSDGPDATKAANTVDKIAVNAAAGKLDLFYQAPSLSSFYNDVSPAINATFSLFKSCPTDSVKTRYNLTINLTEPPVVETTLGTVEYEGSKAVSTVTGTFAGPIKFVKLPTKGKLHRVSEGVKGAQISNLNESVNSLNDVAYYANACTLTEEGSTLETDLFIARYESTSPDVKVVKVSVDLTKKAVNGADITFEKLGYNTYSPLAFTVFDGVAFNGASFEIKNIPQAPSNASNIGKLVKATFSLDEDGKEVMTTDPAPEVVVDGAVFTRDQLTKKATEGSPITKLVFDANAYSQAIYNAEYIFELKRTVPCEIQTYKVTLKFEKAISEGGALNVSINYDDVEPLEFTAPAPPAPPVEPPQE